MSFKDIRTASLTRLDSILSGYLEIKNPINLEDNEERTLVKGYAVKFGEGENVAGETRKLTFKSRLRVGLTKALSLRATDSFAPEIGDLYDDIETVIASFFNDTFLGIPDKLRGFSGCSVANPELIKGDQFVVVWITFDADHKFNINYS